MKKKQLVKPDESKGKTVKPLCNTFGGKECGWNSGTGQESDILF
jgi:hypothetical protein